MRNTQQRQKKRAAAPTLWMPLRLLLRKSSPRSVCFKRKRKVHPRDSRPFDAPRRPRAIRIGSGWQALFARVPSSKHTLLSENEINAMRTDARERQARRTRLRSNVQRLHLFDFAQKHRGVCGTESAETQSRKNKKIDNPDKPHLNTRVPSTRDAGERWGNLRDNFTSRP